MEKLIPLQYYTFVYYNFLLLIVSAVYLSSNFTDINAAKNGFTRYIGFFFVPAIILYIGLRPIDPIFVDMTMYAHLFGLYADGAMSVTEGSDFGFHFFIQYCSKIMTAEMFFLTCAAIYVLPLVYVSVKWFKEYWFFSVLMLIISYSFLGYGVNGIRNGMATSIFLLAISFHQRKVIMVILLLLSISFHKSMSLPIFALVLTFFHNNMRTYLKGWLIAIPISLVVGSLFVSFFAGLGFDDARVGIYLVDEAEQSDVGGFRWDFLLYSATGVFAGWYFIVKRKFNDPFYERLVNIYVIANTFWILVIRAGFSNRFAYLSWFMLAIIIVYPLIKVKLVTRQHIILGRIIAVYFAFTYLFNYLLQ